METFVIKGDFIQLNQLIKAAGWVENGAMANALIEQGQIKVNGVVEHRKRNKLVRGSIVEFEQQKITIE